MVGTVATRGNKGAGIRLQLAKVLASNTTSKGAGNKGAGTRYPLVHDRALVLGVWIQISKHIIDTPKAVPYHQQSHYCRFMIGHSLGRMESRWCFKAILINN